MASRTEILKRVGGVGKFVLIGLCLGLAALQFGKSVATVHSLDKNWAIAPVEDDGWAAATLCHQEAFDRAQARIDVIRRSGVSLEAVALEDIKRSFFIECAPLATSWITDKHDLLTQVARIHELWTEMLLDMEFEPHVIADDFTKHQQASSMIHLSNDRARITAEILTNYKWFPIYWLYFIDDME